MAKYWKDPPQKERYMFTVDGKCLGVMEESANTEKEIKRLEGLKGVEVKIATNDALLMHKAKTKIPGRIVSKMEEISRKGKP